ncbi:putative ribosome biogenesis protein Bms1/Tsr1 [Helianthus annuus]|uniref:Ribosome biogenesis protein Bms1/Tsr1 n=1 Tax=Helianthus annuus TaxID=4232 RepID=A0A251ULD5_HELAN|nr:pre-rRNA-processing protein TSR1 homolog [Helianthus annuus]KAF5803959.1 putative ribosome biogenesis protein Bms1/Tsr1 [Helianthus annuus]KAJ0561854.1 putative ribosome biogenesis protein Bms1/Tsr1 [Helianthus annuus]KAJ0574918.1 putative ribosome biogenesis protein Bms1/Tsr1 [Helianthus annuus]KAJ0739248.1 putative ribosome biogenesis protein Bms1/Tsr1 [Helianthus annuus]KAJ0913538.1 putative ribosome biogenesis protein Bms1/Tsr1 [Helianthus annuus]
MAGGSGAQVNKSHKTRFASKSSRNIHKTSVKDKSKISKPDRNVMKGARAARLQRNKMMREQKRATLLKEKRASSGTASAPRVIVLFGLSASTSVSSLAGDLLVLLSNGHTGIQFPAVASSEYRLRATVLEAPHGDFMACMEMAKIADLIVFVASANCSSDRGSSNYYVDEFGFQCLSVFRSLGLPSSAVFLRDLPSDLKRRNELKKTCISSLSSEFPEDCKFYPADSKDDLHKFMFLFKEQRLTVPHWRTQRPYLMAQKVDMVDDGSGKCTLLITGYLRARNLSVNQLVHVSGAGDFQLGKIQLLKDPCSLSVKKDGDFMDADEVQDSQVIRSLLPDPMKQEPLLVENIPDPLEGEQTWPTEAEMAEADRVHKEKKQKKRTLPRGTSDYQAAWIVDDSDVSGSDSEDGPDNGMVVDEGEYDYPGQGDGGKSDFEDDQASLKLRDSDDETEADSMMMDNENLTKEQIEEDIRKIKEAHAEDEEFPDEVDAPVDVPARKRFAKYRGLKSFRTSSWDPKESLPPEYARIFAFDNFTRTHKHVLSKALDMEQGSISECVPVNSYVTLHIREVPIHIASKLCILWKTMPVIACGLLQHESKISVLHFRIKKHETYNEPIKAKEELIFHVGFRQFITRPTFASDNFNSDKHKMERFLHAGRFSVASVYAPISFPPLPLIVMKSRGDSLAPALAAVGSLKCIDPDKIILKKIILTGYPQRVSKSKAAVRYMFHNPEDVKWFKPVEVWTKLGRRGRIKEPVGTHGAMKCILNGVLQQNDTVCMSLFKRAYPKWPQHWFPLST